MLIVKQRFAMLGLRDGAIQTVSKVEKKWDTNDNNKNCKAKNIAKDFFILNFLPLRSLPSHRRRLARILRE